MKKVSISIDNKKEIKYNTIKVENIFKFGGENMNLSELKVGDKAKVVRLGVENKEIRRHLLDMGLTRGVEIRVKKKAPMGDPVDIELRGYELCISKNELAQIEVEVIK